MQSSFSTICSTELTDKNDFKLEDKIDRAGFDDIHVLDWPIMLYNGIKQTIDMAEDDPLRQDYCPWCRGFGGIRLIAPDLCPACRGTGLVGPRQQCFLLDRIYKRLDNYIYPDWPIWTDRKIPIPPNKYGQWNNFDFVMSARGRVLEAMFDFERRRIQPNVEPRILFPPQEVEEVIKQMKITRRLFPPKPEEHVRVPYKQLPRIAPDNKPVRMYVRSPEEIKMMHLKPYQLKISTNMYGHNYPSYNESRMEVDNQHVSCNEKIDENCLSVNENNSFSGLTFSLEQDPNAICQKSNNEIRDLQRQIQVADFKLKTLKEERRLQTQALCDDNVTRKEKVRREESLMVIQEKIVRLERDLDETTEKISKHKQQFFIPQVAQFPSGDSKFNQYLSASEIKFTQVRCFAVKPGINKGEWEVSSRTVNLSGVRCEDGKKDRDLSPNDHIMGMTLAQDDAFFTPKKTIRSDPVIKIISN